MAIAREIAKGAAWVILCRALTRGISIVSIVILARLLTPEDFGIMALAMAMIAVMELAGNFSFDVTLIQKQDATDEHYNTVWTLGLIFQSTIALLLIASAFPLAAMFEEPQLAYALIALSSVPLLGGLQNIRVVDFRKHMHFHKDFAYLITRRLVGFAVTIPLAFYLKSYWALVIGTIAGHFSGAILSYVLLPYLPRFSFRHGKELFSFSGWLFFNNILMFFRYQASDIIVGKVAGTASLGIFEVSNQVGDLATNELVAPINRAVLPGLSKVNDNPEELAANFLRIVGVITLIAVPAGVGIAAVAEPLVHVGLGEKWLAAIPVITILGIASAVGCLETYVSTACLAVGRPDIVTKLYAVYVTVLLTLTTILTQQFGVVGAAYGWLTAALLNLPLFYTVMLRAIKVPVRVFITRVWRPAVACVAMFLAVRWGLDNYAVLTDSVRAIPTLLLAVAGGFAVYVTAILGLWVLSGRPEGAERELLDKIGSRLPFLKSSG